LRFTIEARELSTEQKPKSSLYTPARMTVEARDEDEAISNFVMQNGSELVSFQPTPGRESIGTVKKDESLYLVRVYAG
jgi:hypothetical protein